MQQAKPSLDQRRSLHAWQTVQEIKSEQSKDKAKDLAGHAKKLPMRLKTAGLGQALAFLNAKLKGNNNPLHNALSDWVVKERKIAAADKSSLIETVVYGSSNDLRRATEEVLAWLEWFNRFAEAEGLKDE